MVAGLEWGTGVARGNWRLLQSALAFLACHLRPEPKTERTVFKDVEILNVRAKVFISLFHQLKYGMTSLAALGGIGNLATPATPASVRARAHCNDILQFLRVLQTSSFCATDDLSGSSRVFRTGGTV